MSEPPASHCREEAAFRAGLIGVNSLSLAEGSIVDGRFTRVPANPLRRKVRLSPSAVHNSHVKVAARYISGNVKESRLDDGSDSWAGSEDRSPGTGLPHTGTLLQNVAPARFSSTLLVPSMLEARRLLEMMTSSHSNAISRARARAMTYAISADARVIHGRPPMATASAVDCIASLARRRQLPATPPLANAAGLKIGENIDVSRRRAHIDGWEVPAVVATTQFSAILSAEVSQEDRPPLPRKLPPLLQPMMAQVFCEQLPQTMQMPPALKRVQEGDKLLEQALQARDARRAALAQLPAAASRHAAAVARKRSLGTQAKEAAAVQFAARRAAAVIQRVWQSKKPARSANAAAHAAADASRATALQLFSSRGRGLWPTLLLPPLHPRRLLPHACAKERTAADAAHAAEVIADNAEVYAARRDYAACLLQAAARGAAARRFCARLVRALAAVRVASALLSLDESCKTTLGGLRAAENSGGSTANQTHQDLALVRPSSSFGLQATSSILVGSGTGAHSQQLAKEPVPRLPAVTPEAGTMSVSRSTSKWWPISRGLRAGSRPRSTLPTTSPPSSPTPHPQQQSPSLPTPILLSRLPLSVRHLAPTGARKLSTMTTAEDVAAQLSPRSLLVRIASVIDGAREPRRTAAAIDVASEAIAAADALRAAIDDERRHCPSLRRFESDTSSPSLRTLHLQPRPLPPLLPLAVLPASFASTGDASLLRRGIGGLRSSGRNDENCHSGVIIGCDTEVARSVSSLRAAQCSVDSRAAQHRLRLLLSRTALREAAIYDSLRCALAQRIAVARVHAETVAADYAARVTVAQASLAALPLSLQGKSGSDGDAGSGGGISDPQARRAEARAHLRATILHAHADAASAAQRRARARMEALAAAERACSAAAYASAARQAHDSGSLAALSAQLEHAAAATDFIATRQYALASAALERKRTTTCGVVSSTQSVTETESPAREDSCRSAGSEAVCRLALHVVTAASNDIALPLRQELGAPSGGSDKEVTSPAPSSPLSASSQCLPLEQLPSPCRAGTNRSRECAELSLVDCSSPLVERPRVTSPLASQSKSSAATASEAAASASLAALRWTSSPAARRAAAAAASVAAAAAKAKAAEERVAAVAADERAEATWLAKEASLVSAALQRIEAVAAAAASSGARRARVGEKVLRIAAAALAAADTAATAIDIAMAEATVLACEQFVCTHHDVHCQALLEAAERAASAGSPAAVRRTSAASAAAAAAALPPLSPVVSALSGSETACAQACSSSSSAVATRVSFSESNSNVTNCDSKMQSSRSDSVRNTEKDTSWDNCGDTSRTGSARKDGGGGGSVPARSEAVDLAAHASLQRWIVAAAGGRAIDVLDAAELDAGAQPQLTRFGRGAATDSARGLAIILGAQEAKAHARARKAAATRATAEATILTVLSYFVTAMGGGFVHVAPTPPLLLRVAQHASIVATDGAPYRARLRARKMVLREASRRAAARAQRMLDFKAGGHSADDSSSDVESNHSSGHSERHSSSKNALATRAGIISDFLHLNDLGGIQAGVVSAVEVARVRNVVVGPPQVGSTTAQVAVASFTKSGAPKRHVSKAASDAGGSESSLDGNNASDDNSDCSCSGGGTVKKGNDANDDIISVESGDSSASSRAEKDLTDIMRLDREISRVPSRIASQRSGAAMRALAPMVGSALLLRSRSSIKVRRQSSPSGTSAKGSSAASVAAQRRTEGFQTAGFRGLVSDDGTILTWAGDGSGFWLRAWKDTYRVRPWRVDEAVECALASTREAMGLARQPGVGTLRAYKLSSATAASLLISPGSALLSCVRDRRHALAEEFARRKATAAAAAARASALASLGISDRGDIAAETGAASLAAALQRLPGRLRRAPAAALALLRQRIAAGAAALARRSLTARAMDARQLVTVLALRGARAIARWGAGHLLALRAQAAEARLGRSRELREAVVAVAHCARAALRLPAGVGGDLVLTAGVTAAAAFARTQRRSAEAGQLCYRLAPGSLGAHADRPVHLWYRMTLDVDKMLTGVRWARAPENVTAAATEERSALTRAGYSPLAPPPPVPFPHGRVLWLMTGGRGPPVLALAASASVVDAVSRREEEFQEVPGADEDDEGETSDAFASAEVAARGRGSSGNIVGRDEAALPIAMAPHARLWMRVRAACEAETDGATTAGGTCEATAEDTVKLARQTELRLLHSCACAAAHARDAALALDAARGGLRRGLLERTVGADAIAAFAALARRRRALARGRDASLFAAAASLLRFDGDDEAALRSVHAVMAGAAGCTSGGGDPTLADIWAFLGLPRSPLLDAIFYFDGSGDDDSFGDDEEVAREVGAQAGAGMGSWRSLGAVGAGTRVALGAFTHAACGFCMLGAADMAVWLFSVVVAGAPGTAESQEPDVYGIASSSAYTPGGAGITEETHTDKIVGYTARPWPDAQRWLTLAADEAEVSAQARAKAAARAAAAAATAAAAAAVAARGHLTHAKSSMLSLTQSAYHLPQSLATQSQALSTALASTPAPSRVSMAVPPSSVALTGAANAAAVGGMTLRAFANALYHLHAPGSVHAAAVVGAVRLAESIASGRGGIGAHSATGAAAAPGALARYLSPSDVRALFTSSPALLSPLLLLQARLRRALHGEAWWAARRQLLAEARALLRSRFETSSRKVLLRRETRAAREEAELRQGLVAEAAAAAKVVRKATRAVSSGSTSHAHGDTTAAADADYKASAASSKINLASRLIVVEKHAAEATDVDATILGPASARSLASDDSLICHG